MYPGRALASYANDTYFKFGANKLCTDRTYFGLLASQICSFATFRSALQRLGRRSVYFATRGGGGIHPK